MVSDILDENDFLQILKVQVKRHIISHSKGLRVSRFRLEKYEFNEQRNLKLIQTQNFFFWKITLVTFFHSTDGLSSVEAGFEYSQ